jgi:carboxymethylenebutenolidase
VSDGFEVTIAGREGWPDTPAFAVLPPGARRGVVVIHELYGRMPEIDRVVQRFGAAGYAAVGPDLFRAAGRFACLRDTMQAMKTGEGPVVAHAAGVRGWLCETAQLEPASVGIIGFCFGGGFALAVGRGWGAISTNYGDAPENPEVLRQLGPTIGCYGGRDRMFRGMAGTLDARLRSVGVEVETHLYPEAGHSFLTDGAPRPANWLTWPLLRVGYHPASADDAWAKILAFFEHHLPATTPTTPGR